MILALGSGLRFRVVRGKDWSDVSTMDYTMTWSGETHVAVTIKCKTDCEGSRPKGTARFYVDGVHVHTQTNFNFPRDEDRANHYIGTNSWNEPNDRFTGKMRDLYFWGVKLTRTQVDE